MRERSECDGSREEWRKTDDWCKSKCEAWMKVTSHTPHDAAPTKWPHRQRVRPHSVATQPPATISVLYFAYPSLIQFPPHTARIVSSGLYVPSSLYETPNTAFIRCLPFFSLPAPSFSFSYYPDLCHTVTGKKLFLFLRGTLAPNGMRPKRDFSWTRHVSLVQPATSISPNISSRHIYKYEGGRAISATLSSASLLAVQNAMSRLSIVYAYAYTCHFCQIDTGHLELWRRDAQCGKQGIQRFDHLWELTSSPSRELQCIGCD